MTVIEFPSKSKRESKSASKAAVKIRHIKEHPEQHHHKNMNELSACCVVDGAVDLSVLQAHHDYAPIGFNGGRQCDVFEGPCNCGAWHKIDENGVRW